MPSESRSMLSWFRVKKGNAQRKEGVPYGYGEHTRDHHAHDAHRHSQHYELPMRPEFVYNSVPEGVSLDSHVFFPPLTGTGNIDHWLRLIEDANLEDKGLVPFQDGKETFAFKPKKVKKSRNKHKKVSVKVTNDHDEDANYINSDSRLKASKPKEYDTSPRCDKFTDDICVDDFEYPEHAIVDEIYKRKDLFQLMYSEVKGDTPLVDGITRDMEENFSSDYYYNNEPTEQDYENYYDGANRTEETQADEARRDKVGFVCRSEVLYAKAKLAKNIKGKWRVIVNAGEFTQTVRMEKCIKPNSRCRFISDNQYESRCAQISAIHRLLVFEKGKGKCWTQQSTQF